MPKWDGMHIGWLLFNSIMGVSVTPLQIKLCYLYPVPMHVVRLIVYFE